MPVREIALVRDISFGIRNVLNEGYLLTLV